MAGGIFGVGKLVTSPVKKSGNAAVDGKAIDKVKDVTESTSKTGIGKTKEGIPKGTGNSVPSNGKNSVPIGLYLEVIGFPVKVSFIEGIYKKKIRLSQLILILVSPV